MTTTETTIKDRIAEAVREAVGNRRAIQDQIAILQKQLTEKQESYLVAEQEADVLSQQRIELLSNGKSTKSVAQQYEKVILERNRLSNDCELISRALEGKHREIQLAQGGIKNAVDKALIELQGEVVTTLQGLFDQADDAFVNWKTLCGDVCKENGVSFNLETHFDPLKSIALSDIFRKSLERRSRVRIAKLAK